MNLAKKLLMLCISAAILCVPAFAEDVVIDLSTLSLGRAYLTVTVDGEVSEALSGTYVPHDVVTIEAPDISGKSFNYWANEEGAVISYNKELKLTVYASTVLNAVYGPQSVTVKPAAAFLSVTRSASQFMFNVIATAPSGEVITEYGLRYSTTKNTLEGLKGIDGVTSIAAGNSEANYLFNVAGTKGTPCYAVAYVTAGGQTYYSNVKALDISDLKSGFALVAGLANLRFGANFDSKKVDLQASLKANLFNVSFDANQGSGAMAPQGFVKGVEAKLNANTFTRSNYEFMGWNTNIDGSGTSYSDEARLSLTKSMTLYAQWQPSEYTISEDIGSEDIGGNAGMPSSGSSNNNADPYANSGTQSNVDSTPPASPQGNTDTPSEPVTNPETPSNNPETPSHGGNEAPTNNGGTIPEVPSVELQAMTDEEIAERFGNTTELSLTGEIANLSELVARLEGTIDLKTLDLSQVTGVSELKLMNTTLESISLEGNQSIKEIQVTGSQTLTTLNLAGSKVKTVNVEGCSNLTMLNVEGAENLMVLNVKATKLTTLNVRNCAQLEVLEAKGSEYLEALDLEGCVRLQYLDVSETAITELNVSGLVQLGTLYCASCRLEKLETEGCEKLQDVDCRNNRLTMLDASKFVNLGSLECSNQHVQNKPLSRLMNFLDFLFGRGRFSASAENADEDYALKVKNLRAYDEAGAEISVEYDPATGEAVFSATPLRLTYDYVTGFEDVMMDVEVTASESGDNPVEENVEVMPSSGGCGTVSGAEALLLMMLLGTLLYRRPRG